MFVFFFAGCKVDSTTLDGVAKRRYLPAIGDAIWLLSPINIRVYVINGSSVQYFFLLAVEVMK